MVWGVLVRLNDETPWIKVAHRLMVSLFDPWFLGGARTHISPHMCYGAVP